MVFLNSPVLPLGGGQNPQVEDLVLVGRRAGRLGDEIIQGFRRVCQGAQAARTDRRLTAEGKVERTRETTRNYRTTVLDSVDIAYWRGVRANGLRGCWDSLLPSLPNDVGECWRLTRELEVLASLPVGRLAGLLLDGDPHAVRLLAAAGPLERQELQVTLADAVSIDDALHEMVRRTRPEAAQDLLRVEQCLDHLTQSHANACGKIVAGVYDENGFAYGAADGNAAKAARHLWTCPEAEFESANSMWRLGAVVVPEAVSA